jgi:hypothetical protein
MGSMVGKTTLMKKYANQHFFTKFVLLIIILQLKIKNIGLIKFFPFRPIFSFFIILIVCNQGKAQQPSIGPTIQIDHIAIDPGYCFDRPYSHLQLIYTNADGVLWWKSPEADGTIIGAPTNTKISYDPGPKDKSRLYFWIYARTTHHDNTIPAIDSIKILGSPMPEPGFEVDTIIPGNPVIIYFKDTSTIARGTIFARVWSFGNGQPSTDVNPIAYYDSLGYYSIGLLCVSDAGCKKEITKNNLIHIDTTLLYTSAIPDYDLKQEAYVFPNPANGILNISSNHIVNYLTVSDITGKAVIRISLKTKILNTVNISSLNPGTYILGIYFKNGSKANYKLLVR